jgi:hypothetical protein
MRGMAGVYATLAVLGALLPLSAFLPWVIEHGLDPARFLTDLFANRVASFFAWDVIVSGVVLLAFVIVQGARDHVPHRWLPIVALCVAGVSGALPLFLMLRERALRGRSGGVSGDAAHADASLGRRTA